MRKQRKKVLSMMLVFTMVMSIMSMEQYHAKSDEYVDEFVDSVSVNYSDDHLNWDSLFGPNYEVVLSTGELLHCSCDDGQILDYEYNEEKKVVTVTVYSSELPKEMTYVIDLTKNVQNLELAAKYDEVVETFISPDGKAVMFSTKYGPKYALDINTGKLLGSSGEGAKIKVSSRKGDIISVVAYSEDLPQNIRYKVDLSKAEADRITEAGIYNHWESGVKVISFDTKCGPYYEICYETGELISSTSENAKVLSYDKNGDIINVKVSSDEFPLPMEYTIDLNKSYFNRLLVDEFKEEIELEIQEGYRFDMNTGEVLETWYGIEPSEVEVGVFEYNRDAKTLLIELGGTRYEFDLTEAEYQMGEEIEWYNVYDDGTIQFDSTRGPWYYIDYKNKKILDKSCSEANIIQCDVDKNMLTLTVWSDELGREWTYEIDLSQNLGASAVDGAGRGDFDGLDLVDYYNIYGNILEFDSEYGPYYKIDLDKKKVIECTSDALYPHEDPAELKNLQIHKDNITITVYSAELPYKMRYVFDITENGQNGTIMGYDKTRKQELLGDVMSHIIDDDEDDKKYVNEETAEKIVAAYNDGLEVITNVETSSKSEEKVDKNEVKSIKEKASKNDSQVAQYVDISIGVYVEGQKLGNIEELTDTLEFTFEVSEDFIKENREFSVLRIHNGVVEEVKVKKVENNLITFETDKFSTYALVYHDVEVPTDNDVNSDTNVDNTPNVPQTGDASEFGIYYLLLIAGFMAITASSVFAKRKTN